MQHPSLCKLHVCCWALSAQSGLGEGAIKGMVGGGGVWVGVKHLSAFCALTDVPLSYQSTLQACDRSSSAPLTADTKCIQCKVLDG